MTYNVFSGTLNPTQSINQSALCGWSQILGLSTHIGGHHKAKNCGCLDTVNTNGLTAIHSSTQINNRPVTSLNTLKSVKLIQSKDINNNTVTQKRCHSNHGYNFVNS